MKVPRFADFQESRFLAWKSSYMVSAVLLGGQLADVKELRFQTNQRSGIVCAELQGCLFSDCQERCFQPENVQILAVPFYQRVDLLMLSNPVFRV